MVSHAAEGTARAERTVRSDRLFDGIDEAAAERLDGAVSEAVVRILRGFGGVADLA